MAPTTPIGSFHTARRDGMPIWVATPMSRSKGNSSIIFAGHRSPSAKGPSSWASVVTMSGEPVSATSSSRNSSFSATSASWSWMRQRLRSSLFVAQSV